LEGLARGSVEATQLTDNAKSYFTPVAIHDLTDSLMKLGALKALAPGRETLRGGMVHQSFRAEYEKKTLSLNIYVMPDGRYEQFLVEE
jgi:hypothetical protein